MNDSEFLSPELCEFSLFVKSTIQNREEVFRVLMVKDQTLLEALEAFNYHKFR